MINNTRLLVVSALFLCLTIAAYGTTYAQEQDKCDRRAKTFKLKIKVQGDMPNEITEGFFFPQNADTLNVCHGDTIEWKLSGKKFYIDFPGVTPFDEKKKNSSNNKIRLKVSAEAKRGESYKYNVGIVDGKVWDPTIIID